MSDQSGFFTSFSKDLYNKLSELNYGVEGMELFEFCYALENFKPQNNNWASIQSPQKQVIEKIISNSNFYNKIELKPRKNGKIILDSNISELNRSLFSGIARDYYDLKWIDKHFYFDIRGFLFIPRTIYFTEDVLEHLRNRPYLAFQTKQKDFNSYHGIGFKDFKMANEKIDQNLINLIARLSTKFNDPLVIAIAGPTAAGKTEFSEYLLNYFIDKDKTINSVEMDNFFLDRDYRESMKTGSMSREGIHFDLFRDSLINLKAGNSCEIPTYDFKNGLSSHNVNNSLKPGASTMKVEPKDIIYIEGNLPFLFDEIIPLIDIKIFYLTDDPIRLKRKWKRDIDFRKKYNSNYLCNRYFKTQFLKAEACYIKQLQTCDIAVDTTQARIYISEKVVKLMDK